MLTRNQQLIKRFFDITVTIILLVFALIPLLLLLVLATLDHRRYGLFVQKRIGQHGKPFDLYKIRSLKGSQHEDVVAILENETKFGGWLRKTRLDELPQLLNVLRGNMSLVGPRPDVSGYADCLEDDDKIILKIKPGITGPATLKYLNEDRLLMQQTNPKEYNDTVIWPDKVAINKNYVKNWSMRKDIHYLIATLMN